MFRTTNNNTQVKVICPEFKVGRKCTLLKVCTHVLVRTFLGFVLAAALNVWGDDWPQFLGPRGNGTSGETGLLDRWNEQGPPLLWHKKVGTGYGAPSVRRGRVVLHHRMGADEVVECYEADSGKTVWRYSYPSQFEDPYGYNNGPRSTPLLTVTRCYTFGAEGKLLCLDLATGRRVWERDTQKDWTVPPAFFGVGSSPVLEADRLLVMIGGQPNAGLVAFDPVTGLTLWESVGQKNWQGQPMFDWPGDRKVLWRTWEKQASYATPVVAAVHGQRRVFCLMRQGLVALDPTNGAVHFSRWFRVMQNESVNAANPVVVGNDVFISAAYYKAGSVLLNVKPGGDLFEEKWKSTVLEVHWSTPVYHNGFLYALSGRNEPDARFRCVEFDTGKLRWDRDESWVAYSTKTPAVYGRGSVILADQKLIVLGEGGKLGLFRLNPDRPEEVCSAQIAPLHHPCWAGPVLSDKHLFLRSEESLVCLDLRR